MKDPSPLAPAIFLMGPTAVGKTELAIALAEKHPIEIISVDSAMVYRGMDIGTGKPSLSERKGIPHHLIDIRDPTETYSAAEFARDALGLMNDIVGRGKIPLLVGGTMLYFRALVQGLSVLPSADPAIRERLSEEAKEIGWPALHARLAMVDKAAALRIHPNDPQRIQRALEVYEISGRAMSELFEPSTPFGSHTSTSAIQNSDIQTPSTPSSNIQSSSIQNLNIKNFDIQSFALMPVERKTLHQRIEKRFLEMLENELISEVEKLYTRTDLTSELPALRAVGYRQVWSYLEGHCSYEEMVNQAIAATRQLAKRQLTWLRMWLRAYPSVHTIPCLQNDLKNNLLGSLETMIHFPPI